MDKYFKFFIVSIGTFFTWLFGAWDITLGVLVTFMALDYITGLVKGFVNRELASRVGLVGIARKSVIFSVLIVAVCLDRLLNSGTWVFRTLVCYFYIANEGLSILENVVEVSLEKGKDVPEFLINLLQQVKSKANKGELDKEGK